MPYEDLLDASELLIEALKLRWHYCQSASHSFPSTTSRFLRSFHEKNRNTSADFTEIETVHDEKKTVEGKTWFFDLLTIFFLFYMCKNNFFRFYLVTFFFISLLDIIQLNLFFDNSACYLKKVETRLPLALMVQFPVFDWLESQVAPMIKVPPPRNRDTDVCFFLVQKHCFFFISFCLRVLPIPLSQDPSFLFKIHNSAV